MLDRDVRGSEMTTARKKAPAKAPSNKPPRKAPAKPAKRPAEQPAARAGGTAGRLAPVTPKIGETPGNLAARSAAFQRRRGPGGQGG